MKVSDLMTAAAVTDSPDDTLAEASAKMWRQQTGSLLVMEGTKLIGIVTERDLLRYVGEGGDPKAVSLRDVMSTNVVTISAERSTASTRTTTSSTKDCIPMQSPDGSTQDH